MVKIGMLLKRDISYLSLIIVLILSNLEKTICLKKSFLYFFYMYLLFYGNGQNKFPRQATLVCNKKGQSLHSGVQGRFYHNICGQNIIIKRPED